jgi:hypothetical protein
MLYWTCDVQARKRRAGTSAARDASSDEGTALDLDTSLNKEIGDEQEVKELGVGRASLYLICGSAELGVGRARLYLMCGSAELGVGRACLYLMCGSAELFSCLVLASC